ncbi:MAG: YhdP family protein [Gammaproteobacteria bacterium]
MPGLIRRLWQITAGVFAGVVILLAVLVGLVRLALVQVPEYRDQIETWAGEALGWPVEIGAMDARLGLRGPELRLSDARILTQDREGTLIVAATGSMQFDSLSLLRGELRPGVVRLAGVSLRIERTLEGRWRLLGEAGPALGDREPAPDDEAPDLPFLTNLPTGELRLEAVRVEFEDLRRALGPWEFLVDALDLQLGDGRLALSASGTLPVALGSDLAMSLAVTSQNEHGRPRDWVAGMSFSRLDLRAVGDALGRTGGLPATGLIDGSFSAEADAGGLSRIAGDVLARDFRPPVVPGDEAAKPYTPYDHVEAAFEWARAASGWHAQFKDLDVERDGRRWFSAAASIVFERVDEARRIEARVDHVELADLLPLTPWLPAATRARVEQLAPSGAVRELEAHLDLPADEARAPDLYVDARFDELSVAPHERWPGVHKLSGRLTGDLYKGAADIDAPGLAYDQPWLFREPLAANRAEVSLEWLRNEDQLLVRVPRLALANDDAAITAEGVVTIPADGGSPHLELEGVARQVRLASAPAYLPVGVMPDKVVAWLDHALRAGRVDAAPFRFNGPTRKFPFRDDDGLFEVEFDIADGELHFDPGWPNAAGLEAGVRFANEGLRAEIRAAKLLDVSAGPARVEIPDLAKGMLAIKGEARGTLAALRGFALASEQLGEILGPGLAPAEFLAGRGSAEIDLLLPLRALKEFRARVDLRIADGVVSYGFLGEPARDIEALIRIDNARVSAQGASATLAGRPVAVDILVGDDDAIRVEMRGDMDAGGLARVLRIPLDTWVEGESDWYGHLQFPAPDDSAPLKMEIASRLEGFSIDLPEPLRKSADEARSLRVTAEFPQADLMHYQFEWDDALRIAASLDRSGPEPVLAAVPGAGGPPGIVFSGTVGRLDLVEWLGVEFPRELRAPNAASAIAGGKLLVGELSAPMIRLSDALLGFSRSDERWVVELAADGATGRVEIPFALYGDEPVLVRLERLELHPGGAARAKDATTPDEVEPSRLHPAKVPALDIEIDQLLFGTVRFGSVSARVLHEGDGVELIGLEAGGDSFMLQAEGRSRLSESVDASRLGIRMRSTDVGKTLEYMGFRRSIDASEGNFDADVTWPGGLRGDWLSAIEGEAAIMIRDGKLVGVEPGAGRVFGLLSVQALPRRLALDFKDVFGEGTAFDQISGEFRFSEGNAFTDNLLMRGPSADMVVVGRTGLVARDYDQTAVIAADLGRTLPVAGTVVGGPAVGAALFLLSEMLRKPFQAEITYRMTGTWENPVIEKLGSRSVAPPPDAAEERPEDQRGED